MTDTAYATAVRVNELTHPHTHRERQHYDANGTSWDTWHYVRVPSLLDQLLHLQPGGAGDTSKGGFKSQPPGRIEAIDTLDVIDDQASRWVKRLGYDDDRGTAGCIQLLHGLHIAQPDDVRDEIRADIRRWWTMARVCTGWDSPAWRPANTCPLCGKRGTLRVRLMSQIGLCIDCGETWTPDTIGLLADHIRAENHDTDSIADQLQCAVGDEEGQTA